MIKKVLILVIPLLFLVSVAQAASTKIGIVDVPKILKISLAGQEAKAAFEKEVSAKKRFIAEREEVARRLNNDMRKEGNETIRREKEELFGRAMREIRRLRTELEEESKRVTISLIKEIMEVVKEIGVRNKYTLILERSKGVLFAPNAIDITNDVLKRYDNKKKKEEK